MTICWHVDNLKASHVKPKVVDRIVKYLQKEHESIFEDGSGAMSVSQGKVHKYLGMDLNISVRGQVKISMFNFIDEILAAFDKAEPKGAGMKSSAASKIFSLSTQTARRSPQTRPYRSTTLWPRCYILPQEGQAGYLYPHLFPGDLSDNTRYR